MLTASKFVLVQIRVGNHGVQHLPEPFVARPDIHVIVEEGRVHCALDLVQVRLHTSGLLRKYPQMLVRDA